MKHSLILIFCLHFFTGLQAQPLICNDNIQVALDANCTWTLDADQILEGGPYCYPCMTVEVDKTPATPACNGPWLPPTLNSNDIGKIYCVRVSNPANGTSCFCNVLIQDNLPPVLQCPPNQTVGMDPGNCFHTAANGEFDPLIAADNCSAVQPKYTLTPITSNTSGVGNTTLNGVTFDYGSTRVRWRADDFSGNTSTCTFTVDVIDNEPPQVNCPSNMTLNTDPGQCTYTVQGGALDPLSWSENCSAGLYWNLTGANNDSGSGTLAGYTLQAGTTTVDWLVFENISFSFAACSFVVQINDAEAPLIVCPPAQIRNTDPGLCSYQTQGNEFDPLSMTDNCAVTSTSWFTVGATGGNGNTPTLAGRVLNKGTTAIGWIARDAANHSGTCQFNVTVLDAEPPVFTNCPGSTRIVNMSPNCNIIIPNLINLTTAVDNCPGVVKTQTPTAGTLIAATHNQIFTVVVTARDASNNTATCQMYVLAKDITPPVITTCPPARRVYPTASCEIEVPDMTAELQATDCTTPLQITQAPAAGTMILTGVGLSHYVTMQVLDGAGNSKTCTVKLTVARRYMAYITDFFYGKVSVINTGTDKVEAVIPMNQAAGVSASKDGKRVYVTNGHFNSMSVINTSTNAVIANIPLGNFPVGICVNNAGTRVYVTNSIDGTVSVVNTQNNSVISTIPLAINQDIFGVAVNPSGTRVYVGESAFINNQLCPVAVINAQNNTLLTHIPATNMQHGFGVCTNPAGSRVFFGDAGNNHGYSVINTANNSILTTITPPFGEYYSLYGGICTNLNGSRLFVASHEGVKVFNTANNTLLSDLQIGYTLGISITPDGSKLYAARNAGDVVVINALNNTIMTTIPVGGSPVAFGNFIGGPTCPSNPFTGDGTEPEETDREAEPQPELLQVSDFTVGPNPFQSVLDIRLSLTEAARAQFKLTDIQGNTVREEAVQLLESGEHQVSWNTEDLPPGVYLAGMQSDNGAWQWRKIVLMR